MEVFPLVVERNGTGDGNIVSSPLAIDCGVQCAATFPAQTTVTLTATPDGESRFDGWSGACSGRDICVLVMTAPWSAAADFTHIETLTVSTEGTSSGVVTSEPPGVDCQPDCSADFDPGTIVTLTATPDLDAQFVGWTGDCAGMGTCALMMDGDRQTAAVFDTKTYSLDVIPFGTGGGTVTLTPPGIDCGAPCSVEFDVGTVVTLQATANATSSFVGWVGDCIGVSSCQLTMDGPKDVSSNFELVTHALSVTLDGNGFGSVLSDPLGIDCGATCTYDYVTMSSVTLTATATSNSAFVGWSGACAGTDPCTLTVDAPVSATATFHALLNVARAGTGIGTITSLPAGIDCGADCAEVYGPSTTVDLVATPSPPSVFNYWSGECVGPGPCAVFVDAPRSVTGTFSVAGGHLWARRIGDQYVDSGVRVTHKPDGQLLVTGLVGGTVDFGGGPISVATDGELFLAEYNADGSYGWAAPLGDFGAVRGFGVDDMGDAFLSGRIPDEVDFGGGPIGIAGDVQAFAAKFSGTTGGHIWSRAFGDTELDRGNGLAVDPNGDVIVVGQFAGDIDFGDGTHSSAGSDDAYIAKLGGADGAVEWSITMGGSEPDKAWAAACDANGDVVVAGSFRSPQIDFGDGSYFPTAEYNVFVAKYRSSDGGLIWKTIFDGASWAGGLALDGDDNVYVHGYFLDLVDFGEGPVGTAGLRTLFFVKLDSAGAHVWTQLSSAVSGLAFGEALAVDGQNDPYFVGYTAELLDVGGGPIDPTGGWSSFVVKRDAATGAHLWSQSYSGTATYFRDVAVGTANNVIVGGEFQDTVSFGSDVLTSAGSNDIVILNVSQ